MNYNGERKKGNGLLVVVIILLVILIGVGSVLIYQNYQDKNDNIQDVGTTDKTDDDNVGSENNNQETVVKDLSLDSTVVKTLSDRVIGIFTNNMTSPYEDYYFKRDKIIMADEPISMRLAISSYHLGESSGFATPNGVETVLEEEDVKNEYEKLFGKNSYKISEFETDCGKKFSYLDGYYTSVSPDGCGGTSVSYSVSELAYAKEIIDGNKNTIEIYEYYYYEDNYDAIKGTGDVKFYSDYKQTNLITSGQHTKNELIEKFSDKLGLYKYTFVPDSNSTYVFTSVERVK